MSWNSFDGESGGKKILMMMGASLLLFVVAGLYIFHSDQSQGEYKSGGFDFKQVSRPQPLSGGSYAFPSRQTSPAPMFGSDVAAPTPAVLGGAAPSAASPSAAASTTANTDVPSDERRREQEFLAQHREELGRYVQKLGRITDRYYKQYPVVRDVDRAFGSMGRYMEVKRRYDRDGDPYEFVRGAIALPEVRGEISRRLTDPEVWKASLGMISEALKDPPPPGIYNESARLMGDPEVSSYMKDFTADATKNIPTAMSAIPPNTDMGPIMKVVQDVAPQSLPNR